MTKITGNNVVQELLKRIPEIKEYSAWEYIKDELDSPTIVFDLFGSFLLDRITSCPPEDLVIKKSFAYINELMDSNVPENQNLAAIGVFEVLAGSKRGLEVAEKMLNDAGKKWLNKIKQNFDPQ